VVRAKNYGHDLEAMTKAVDDETYVIWVANPNNPTGTFLRPDEMEAFLRRVPERVLVVLDEAYNEYMPGELRGDSVKWLKRHPNLIITRTFSKAYGLAGLRVGYALAHPSVADIMNRVRQPFNVNSIALAAATAALDDMEFVARSYAENLQGLPTLRRARSASASTSSRPTATSSPSGSEKPPRSTSGFCAAASSCARSAAATSCRSICA